MNMILEQNVYILIFLCLRGTLGEYGMKLGNTFSTPLHGVTIRNPGFISDNSESEERFQLGHRRDRKNVARFGDAEHRGSSWYDDQSSSEDSNKFDEITSTSSSSTSKSSSSSESSEASSFETKEERIATRVYRTCTTCPHDMLKKYKNMGIKWICAGYQRARRSFKSECMMRYRNCQDGTLFVKMYDYKCKNDPFHGRHFFYHYKT